MDPRRPPARTGEGAEPLPLAPRSSVVSALRRLLHPVVRLLLRSGITYPYLTDVLKVIYVETATKEFGLGGRSLTDSRVTLLTGVHRKDVRRLRNERDPEIAPASALTLGTRIVARWLSDPAYLGPDGAPCPLPRTPHKGGAGSFAALVEKVSKNVRPRSVLDELIRLGVVEIDADDRVRLVARGFIPGKELDAHAYYFGEALHDHIAAAVDNLGGHKPAWLERSVYYDELSPAAVARLIGKSEELSMHALQEINSEGMALEASDPPAPAQRMRMRLGVYFYAEPVPQPPATVVPNGASRKRNRSSKG